jgi:hypothetical protein
LLEDGRLQADARSADERERTAFARRRRALVKDLETRQERRPPSTVEAVGRARVAKVLPKVLARDDTGSSR